MRLRKLELPGHLGGFQTAGSGPLEAVAVPTDRVGSRVRWQQEQDGKRKRSFERSFQNKSEPSQRLGCGLFRYCSYARLREFETDEPGARNAAAAGFGRSEFPAAGGLQRQIGEILAGAGRVQIG